MTFGALPYEHREAKTGLSSRYDVSGIPTLIMLSPVIDKETGERTLINDNVRSMIMSGDYIQEYPFVPKNYGDVNSADDINGKKCVVVFHEQGDDEEQNKLINVMKEVASSDQDVNYYWCVSPQGLGNKIRKVVGIEEMKDDPEMIILDIPDEGGYYIHSTGSTETNDLTVEKIQAFVKSPGERKQLN